MRVKLKTVLAGVSALAALGVGTFVWSEARSRWVDAGYVGILYDASRGIDPRVIKPSRVYVGFRQRLYTYPTKLQSARYVQATDEGEQKAADGILITTSDNANTTFDVAVIYRVRPEDAMKVFQAFGPVDVTTIQTSHIRRAVKEAVNEVGPRYDIFQLMGPKRQEASQLATVALQKRMAPNGITVDSVMLLTAYPTPETMEKINRRINQYTEYEIAVLRQQIAEVSRQSNVITARARTEATRLTAATTQDKSLEQLQLQADGEAIEKWDGHLPAVRSAPGQTLILGDNALGARRAGVVARPQPVVGSETSGEGGE